MLGIGFGEIVFIVIIVLIFFGPKSIPEVAQTISKGVSKFRGAQEGLQKQLDELKKEMNESIRIQEEINKKNQASPPVPKPIDTNSSDKETDDK